MTNIPSKKKAKAVAGGNFLIMGDTEDATLKAAEAAIQEEKVTANAVRAMDVGLKGVKTRQGELLQVIEHDKVQQNRQSTILTTIINTIQEKHLHHLQKNQ